MNVKELGVMVDKQDQHLLEEYSWYININGYVVASTYENGRPFTVSLARLIMNAGPGELVDHRDQDPKNNQRENLRMSNKRKNRLNSCKASGIRVTTSGKYQVRIGHVNYGSYTSYKDAVIARQQAVERILSEED